MTKVNVDQGSSDKSLPGTAYLASETGSKDCPQGNDKDGRCTPSVL